MVVTTVTSIETLRRSPRAALFEGHDDIPVSMFITEYDRGEGPDQHLHPYAEVFVVQAGTARFTVDGNELRADPRLPSATEDTDRKPTTEPAAAVPSSFTGPSLEWLTGLARQRGREQARRDR